MRRGMGYAYAWRPKKRKARFLVVCIWKEEKDPAEDGGWFVGGEGGGGATSFIHDKIGKIYPP